MDWQELTSLTRGRPFVVERVRLADGGVAIEGAFELPQLAQLNVEDQVFVTAFVRCHGSIKEMERTFGVSYPTIKSRLNRITRMLDFVETDPAPASSSPEDARPRGRAKYLRVVVDSLEDGEPGRVNVRVPLRLLRAGVKLAALIPPQALERVNVELGKSGVPFDLSQLKPEQLEELVDHLDEMTVEVDQTDARVRVFCE
jgi:hypothetical protein